MDIEELELLTEASIIFNLDNIVRSSNCECGDSDSCDGDCGGDCSNDSACSECAD